MITFIHLHFYQEKALVVHHSNNRPHNSTTVKG